MTATVRAVVATFIAVVVLPGIAIGQSKPNERAKPITVCEVLANLRDHNGKAVAVLGRLDHVVSLIDGRSFLAEDRCEHPLVTDGYRWPNKILIWQWEEGLPKPPQNTPEIDHETLVEKLLFVRKGTALHFYEASRREMEGRTTQDVWGSAYGSIFVATKLERGCKSQLGCGGFYGAPALIVVQPNSVRSVKDEELRHKK